ncbi:peroxidase 60-like [Telopea speciosissima]|uniref:peroxidase 60-like n=1 Tax=Telopea speciosissima TaxID=54955 RepID=UPI001CC37C11|nr:peroxidase 60-like [Telopea speciosissima]
MSKVSTRSIGVRAYDADVRTFRPFWHVLKAKWSSEDSPQHFLDQLYLIVLRFYLVARMDTVEVGYYNGKCTNSSANVETIVKNSMTTEFAKDITVVPALIRLQFHDCFVRGCDASILLDGNSTEKNTTSNLTLRGYDVIDDIKSAVESQCGRGIVSCADIIIMATREAVVLGGGQF